MKLPHQLLLKLSPLAEAVSGEPLIEPFVSIERNDEEQLLLSSSYGEFVFDKRDRTISQQGREISAFEAIQSVDIGSFPGGRGEASWSIVLFRGLLDRVTVARTYDDGEASVVAARLAAAIGCKVVSLR